jgi:uncharacterized protein with HEPN domain
MRADDRVRIRHMVGAAEAACRFAAGRHKAALDSDQMLAFAIVRAIELLGEPGSRVSENTRQGLGTIPWGNLPVCATA